MKKSEYARMAERESSYWWHVGRLRIIETYIQAATKNKKKLAILNVGCGTGGTIDVLERYGTTDNVDISEDAIKFMKQRGYKRIKKVAGTKLPFEKKKYDLVCAFDVLEHIAEEGNALKEWTRVLKDDGAIIITVPAYQWLWTDHDVSLHHVRRYTKKQLVEAANKAGLKPVKKSYAIVFSLPLVVSFRFITRLLRRQAGSETSYVDVPEGVNSAFSALLYGEAKLHKSISFPAGTSVIAVFQKADV